MVDALRADSQLSEALLRQAQFSTACAVQTYCLWVNIWIDTAEAIYGKAAFSRFPIFETWSVGRDMPVPFFCCCVLTSRQKGRTPMLLIPPPHNLLITKPSPELIFLLVRCPSLRSSLHRMATRRQLVPRLMGKLRPAGGSR